MESQHTNRLIHATSPYLLQHAHNPVDWYPWGEEALRKAKAEDKPIFLSIGYSACHWCHVMEEQSFENEDIAEIMNSHFINIKVDREERPDLDEIYMTAVQAMTGSGGWPMSVFLTPELKPFFGGTYFPPSDMYGRPGFKTILLSLSNAYANRRDEVDESAQTLADHIRQVVSRECSDASISSAWVAQAKQEMASVYDPDYGGFGHAPKFPHSMDLGLLLRYYKRSGDKEALQMVELTLAQMAKGGMYDQLGGGFHRYSVDEKWLIPHFEKMLYDNALLSKVYLEAYQVTKNNFHQKIAREILNYILREMTSETGAFYSTQDADTAEGEGAFFAWTPAQIHEVLGKEHGEIACRYYGIEPGGNFEQGKSVLHINQDLDPLAEQNNQSKEELLSILKEAQCKLFAAREQREKPTTDTKILSDWNGLMISSMAFAANVLQDRKYAEAAEKAADYIMQTHWREKTLLHTSKNGDAHTNGFLCDYAYLANGLIDLYEANRNPETLKQAISITDSMVKRFWDKEEGAFFFTEEGQTDVIARSKLSYDTSVPSGNSIAILVLCRLGEMTGNIKYREKAEKAIQVFADQLEKRPSAFSQMLCAIDFLTAPPKTAVAAAKNKEGIQPFQEALFDSFLPNKTVLYLDTQSSQTLLSISRVVEGKEASNGQTTVYVCEGMACKQPVHTIDEMMAQMEATD